MDLVMPRLDGVAAMRRLRERAPASRVIVLTSFLDDDRLMPALQAGAAGYLLKDVEPAELARAVRSACAEQAMIDPTVAARLLRTLSEPGPGAMAGAGGDPGAALTRARARGAGADRRRAIEQADRAGAGDRREDGQDPRRPSAGQARASPTAPRPRCWRSAAGWCEPPAQVLGPIAASKRDPAAPTVAVMSTNSNHHRSITRPRAGAGPRARRRRAGRS